jgi:hypothetical protein
MTSRDRQFLQRSGFAPIAVRLLGLVMVTLSAMAVDSPASTSSVPLSQVLESLRGEGLSVIYSDRLVDASMRVSWAGSHGDPRRELDRALASCGLAAIEGPGGSVLVVRGAAMAAIGVVSHVKVLSDKVADVSSLEAWRKSFIPEGMTDEQKAMKVWESVVMFRHQCEPPKEFLMHGDHAHDAIKNFNVYGYSECCCASSYVEQLARYLGLPARGKGINRHSVSEVSWDGDWHLLDASLMTYFPKGDGTIASVDELVAGVSSWFIANPEFTGSDPKLRAFMRNSAWRNGPDILSRCPFYDDNGWLMAATHGWYSTMLEYDGSANFQFEYGYSQGYEVNIQLRQGERLTRNWSNIGLHVNRFEGGACSALQRRKDMAYSRRYGDLAPGRVGNGKLEYEVPLSSRALASSALALDNIAFREEDARGAALHVKDATRPGSLTLRMPCSYVYLSGALTGEAVIASDGSLAVMLSQNNGLDWAEVATITASGPLSIDLTPWVQRRYDYRVRFDVKGEAGLESLRFAHDIQHSQRPLPALAQGGNTISFSAASQEGTITVEGKLERSRKGTNSTIAAFHPQERGFLEDSFFIAQSSAELSFPIVTPGDIVRVHMGSHYRARGEDEGWEYQLSFDGGNTWLTMGSAHGPTPGSSSYATCAAIPSGTRTVLARYSGTKTDTCGLFDVCVKVDYKEPHGGFSPVRITYAWDEDGVAKSDVHVARNPEEIYSITCGGTPTMKSIVLELDP